MAVDVLDRQTPSGALPPAPRRARGRGVPEAVVVLVAAALAFAAWLPFTRQPLSPDEAGFLMLARHWRPGTSLYGNYWVDRPPLLMWLYDLAAHVGPIRHPATGLTVPGVKLMGGVASGLSVLIAWVVAYVVAPTRRWSHLLVVVAAAAFLATPSLGMPEANGELLGLPFVLAGTAFLVAAARRGWGLRTAVLTAGAGASAVGAALVKQNIVDVFVLAIVLVIASRRRGPHVWLRIGTFVAASGATLAVALWAAALRGTSPAELWDATVVFRFQAAAVINASASSNNTSRLVELLLAFLSSGLAVILVLAAIGAVRGRRSAPREPGGRSPDDLRAALTWAALAMALWELVSVVGGGSYWLHYLTCLIPGTLLLLALATSATTSRWRRTLLAGCVGYAVVASAVAWAPHATQRVPISDDARVQAYLRSHSRPSDGVVSAFGHPNIVAGSGLSSPYEHLWSLPVRVRDPRLTEFARVLTGPRAPRWVVVAGTSLSTWGVDATRTQRIFEAHYGHLITFGPWEIWERRPGGAGR